MLPEQEGAYGRASLQMASRVARRMKVASPGPPISLSFRSGPRDVIEDFQLACVCEAQVTALQRDQKFGGAVCVGLAFQSCAVRFAAPARTPYLLMAPKPKVHAEVDLATFVAGFFDPDPEPLNLLTAMVPQMCCVIGSAEATQWDLGGSGQTRE